MRERPLILAVDDIPENLEILRVRLEANGFDVVTAADGEEGLAVARAQSPDLVLLDIMMPKRDGISVLRELKSDPALEAIPVILVTAKADTRDVVEGLDAGGDDYLTKPFEHSALLARVRSMLRQKALHDKVQEQSETLRSWNQSLEERVAAQVAEIQRMSRLRRFLPKQVADLVLKTADDVGLLKSDRREITALFCDLRGFTAFAEVAEPEEVMTVLASYHAATGPLIDRYEGTLERFLGDGMMVLFNAPLPCANPAERAVRLAVELRDSLRLQSARWAAQGFELSFGIGIAHGHATVGSIGFDARQDYTAIGTVVNQASRLCGEAGAEEILITQRVASVCDGLLESESIGTINLKGFRQAINCHRLLNVTS
jgi:DNA-binding response OmpR family regulator